MRCTQTLTIILILITTTTLSHADITITGSVDPADPAVWPDWGHIAQVGVDADGSVRIDGGSDAYTGNRDLVGTVAGTTGSVTIDGEGSTWSLMRLWLGDSGVGTITITDGGRMINRQAEGGVYSILARNPEGVGTVNVDGEGSSWEALWEVIVGLYGQGTLDVTNGGYVSAHVISLGYWDTAVPSEISIDGARSRLGAEFVTVGVGTLDVTNGGHVEASTTLEARYGALSEIHLDNGTINTGNLNATPDQLTGTGTIHVTGTFTDGVVVLDEVSDLSGTTVHNALPGQNVTVTHLYNEQSTLGAGYRGTGELTISNGLTIESESAMIGNWGDSTGTVTVTGEGTSWAVNDIVYVGGMGIGSLNILDGAEFLTETEPYQDVYIGYGTGSEGYVTIDGPGSQWLSSSAITLGYGDRGELTITNGGLVSGTIAKVSNMDAFVNMASGGMWMRPGQRDGSLAEFGGSGMLRYWDDSLSDWSMLTDATLGTDYTLRYLETGEMAGYTLLTVGEHIPGPVGSGDLNGDGVVDPLDVEALAAILQSGTNDPVFDINGDWEINNDDLTFLVQNLLHTSLSFYDEDTQAWMMTGTEFGDFNLDGEVGILDLGALGDAYGTSGGWASGDANGDGIIGILDLGLLGDNYGYDRNAIPEPASAVLLLSGVLTVLKRRR